MKTHPWFHGAALGTGSSYAVQLWVSGSSVWHLEQGRMTAVGAGWARLHTVIGKGLSKELQSLQGPGTSTGAPGRAIVGRGPVGSRASGCLVTHSVTVPLVVGKSSQPHFPHLYEVRWTRPTTLVSLFLGSVDMGN